MGTISAGAATIHFTDSGAGAPVVLGHSYFCSGEMWSPVVPALESAHRIINIDLRGHGRSSPIEHSVTLYDLLDDHLAVLDALGIESAVWAGLSIGGMIALRAALTAPERVRALILLATDAQAEQPARRVMFEAMSIATRAVGLRPFLPEICRRMFGRTTRREKPELVEQWRRRFVAADLPSMRRCMAALDARDSLLDRLGEIAVPALVVVGEEDVSLPPSRSRAIAAAIPKGELHIIPRAGHLCVLERPEEVFSLMSAFLAARQPGRDDRHEAT